MRTTSALAALDSTASEAGRAMGRKLQGELEPCEEPRTVPQSTADLRATGHWLGTQP